MENFVLVIICLAVIVLGAFLIYLYLRKNKPETVERVKVFDWLKKNIKKDPVGLDDRYPQEEPSRPEIPKGGTRTYNTSNKFIMEQLDHAYNVLATFVLDRIFLDDEGVFILREKSGEEPIVEEPDAKDIILKPGPDADTVSSWAYCLQSDNGKLLLFLDGTIKDKPAPHGKIFYREEVCDSITKTDPINPMYRFDPQSNQWIVETSIEIEDDTLVCLGQQMLRFKVKRVELPKPDKKLIREPEAHRESDASAKSGTRVFRNNESAADSNGRADTPPVPDSPEPQQAQVRRAPIKRQ